MGEHWKGAHKIRRAWPKNLSDDQLPRLFNESELGPTRRKWFLSYYRESGDCLVWMGGKTRGYGCVGIGGRVRKAHRVAYALHYGVDPGESEVCHTCDNPSCGRREHLFLGTRSDNERDKVTKGRHNPRRGESAPNSRLTEAKVREIRLLSEAGMSQRTLAIQFGVARMTIKSVLDGNTWRHVE